MVKLKEHQKFPMRLNITLTSGVPGSLAHLSLVIGLQNADTTEKGPIFSPSTLALKKKKNDHSALCSTTQIIGFKTFLKLLCSEIISAWIAFRF